MALRIDFMEYADNTAAQTAYVTNLAACLQSYSESTIKTQGLYSLKGISTAILETNNPEDFNDWTDFGNSSYSKVAMGFKVSSNVNSTFKISIFCGKIGSPTDNLVMRIETDNSGSPSGTLVDANATATRIGSSLGGGGWNDFTFSTAFALTASTQYHIVLQRSGSLDDSNCYRYHAWYVTSYANGLYKRYDGSWATWSTRGGLFKIIPTNTNLTRTVSPTINLTNKSIIKFDIRASRTGSNIKIGIKDSGGTITEITPNILSANTWQTINLNISAVSNVNKDAIDAIIITIVNTDADNTFYIDNMYVRNDSNFFAFFD